MRMALSLGMRCTHVGTNASTPHGVMFVEGHRHHHRLQFTSTQLDL